MRFGHLNGRVRRVKPGQTQAPGGTIGFHGDVHRAGRCWTHGGRGVATGPEPVARVREAFVPVLPNTSSTAHWMKRSSTVVTSGGRAPPDVFGLATRRPGFGTQVPARSRDLISARWSFRCAPDASTVIPPEPGAPCWARHARATISDHRAGGPLPSTVRSWSPGVPECYVPCRLRSPGPRRSTPGFTLRRRSQGQLQLALLSPGPHERAGLIALCAVRAFVGRPTTMPSTDFRAAVTALAGPISPGRVGRGTAVPKQDQPPSPHTRRIYHPGP